MSLQDQLREEYETLYRQATILAGGLSDLAQRATVYRQIFRDSGRNHIFPLIAAHGALWARGYFRFGFWLGDQLVWQYAHSRQERIEHRQALDAFADAFRDINRRVCVDTYANFHFTAKHGEHSAASDIVPADLLAVLAPLSTARRAGRALRDRERQAIFTAHFLNEQQHVVGPSIDAAVARFDWPLLKFLALRPIIRFAYFPAGRRLWFRDFSRREERIEKGREAFAIGSQLGWSEVEARLRNYDLLPARFFEAPETHFAEMRATLLGA